MKFRICYNTVGEFTHAKVFVSNIEDDIPYYNTGQLTMSNPQWTAFSAALVTGTRATHPVELVNDQVG